jgi:hypothetical protein
VITIRIKKRQPSDLLCEAGMASRFRGVHSVTLYVTRRKAGFHMNIFLTSLLSMGVASKTSIYITAPSCIDGDLSRVVNFHPGPKNERNVLDGLDELRAVDLILQK